MEITHNTFGKSNPNKEEQPMSKNDLFQLLELGRIEEEIKIGNVVFKLKTLSAIELNNIYKTFAYLVGKEEKEIDEIMTKDRSKYLELSATILANAIVSVNNQPMETIADITGEDPIGIKIDIISNFQWPVINKLMDFYTSLSKRAGSEFGEELKK